MLDKIKELVTTCDSKNIELAIAIGVNMEGYDRLELESILFMALRNIGKEWFMLRCFGGTQLFMEGAKVYGQGLEFSIGVSTKGYKNIIEDFTTRCIDAYLGL